MTYVPPRFISHVVFLRHSATKAEVQWSNGDNLHSIELFAVCDEYGSNGWWSMSPLRNLSPTVHANLTRKKLNGMMPEYPHYAMDLLLEHMESVVNSMYIPVVDADGVSTATEIKLRYLAF